MTVTIMSATTAGAVSRREGWWADARQSVQRSLGIIAFWQPIGIVEKEKVNNATMVL
jgi:hypothetical protein